MPHAQGNNIGKDIYFEQILVKTVQKAKFLLLVILLLNQVSFINSIYFYQINFPKMPFFYVGKIPVVNVPTSYLTEIIFINEK